MKELVLERLRGIYSQHLSRLREDFQDCEHRQCKTLVYHFDISYSIYYMNLIIVGIAYF